MDKSYEAIMNRQTEIIRKSIGVDYDKFEIEGIAFDYQKMMKEAGYTIAEVQKIQRETAVGNTPLVELKNIMPWLERILIGAKVREYS